MERSFRRKVGPQPHLHRLCNGRVTRKELPGTGLKGAETGKSLRGGVQKRKLLSLLFKPQDRVNVPPERER